MGVWGLGVGGLGSGVWGAGVLGGWGARLSSPSIQGLGGSVQFATVTGVLVATGRGGCR
jgi:hypothetical protein